VGYVFKKLDYPVAPLVLALVLGDRAEVAFRQSMILSGGSLGVFWNNGIAATLSTLAIVIALFPFVTRVGRRQSGKSAMTT
jgi:TctA family transporter